ncbi:MAG TPA: transglycosylase domain-containing protein [Candidatus Saccharibacteria bacterium]|nr:transglycosylase domain-containing protein [Candidatus Saccharibacteria bacterium]
MAKKPSKSRKHSVYANLAHKRKTKKDAASRKRAEYLASLPKHPVKRFFYRLHPKRVFKFWFSKRGFLLGLKILGVTVLLGVLFVGGLFAYFRKDLDQIRPEELAKRVQTTVSRYYDRNGVLLWEDKGSDNYKLVVKSEEISDYLKKATVAIEDRDFYKHHGVSPSGIVRAAINNTSGDSVQGGSTLTQQLVKQVFFTDEAHERGLAGIPRKIKEAILAIEVERMYNKDQILTLYLNESPYGGRRNGAESAAQTYFGKSAKDLTLPEAALLAAIPQNPSIFNPYNIAGHTGLIDRQHTVLDYMAREGFITQKEADAAKKVAIIDTLRPETDQFADIKAPHFVLAVRSQLQQELGAATVGKGGLTVKTTLDIRVQEKLEAEMNSFFASGIPESNGISNGAATVEDTQTGQIIALLGSRDFRYPGFGQDNASTAFIQPGSTVKPLVFAKLFEDKGSGQQNYGSGTILKDERIDNIYGARLNNWDNRFMGDLTIRRGLSLSRNIPAVKAMYVNGVDESLAMIHDLGAKSYCTQEAAAGVGLSSAIGGCGVKQIDLVNAYSTLGRSGIYKPSTMVLEVKNSSNETIKKWKDDSKQVLDPQIAYILADILSDPDARASLHGRYPLGLYVDGVQTAGKTGTSDKDSRPKDLWIMNFSPTLTMGLWLGNSDTSTIRTSNSVLGGSVVSNVLSYTYKDVYASEGKWKPGDWFQRPDGIQQQGRELYPSWWNKNQGQTKQKLTFDRVSKFKATSCTPEAAKIEIEVLKSIDPVTKKEVFIAPDGYDANKDDDKHDCNDPKPGVTISGYSSSGSGTVSFTISQGKFPLRNIEVLVNGKSRGSVSGNASSAVVGSLDSGDKITIIVSDEGYYTTPSSPYTVN